MFSQGSQQYAISTVLQKYGYGPKDKQKWLNDTENGKVSLVQFMREVRETESQATPVDIFVFKLNRFVHLLIWPQLDALAGSNTEQK
jgi:hypothetical protein